MATIKEKAALGRAKTKKELEEIAELLAIAGEGVGRVTRSDIANKLKQITGLNRAAEGKSRLDKLVNNARKVVKNRMTKDDAYKMDDNKIVPKKKPPRDIKPKPKPQPDIKPKLKLKPPRDERAKKNPFRLSSDRQPGIEVANTRTNKTLKNEGRFKERLSPTDFDPSTAYSKPIGFAKGGEVKEDKSPNSGMITQRGWGASKKT